MAELGLDEWDSWHCKLEEEGGPRLFCPVEGCSQRQGCKRERELLDQTFHGGSMAHD